MNATWDDNSGIRERLALLVALVTIARQRREPVHAINDALATIGDYRYDPSRDWWIGMPNGAAAIVQVSAEASVQLARLRKLGIEYHEAMRLCGYDNESEAT